MADVPNYCIVEREYATGSSAGGAGVEPGAHRSRPPARPAVARTVPTLVLCAVFLVFFGVAYVYYDN